MSTIENQLTQLLHNPAKADRRSVSKRTLFFKNFC